jgi:LuxR family maltose regulon positive regulatory protein
MLTLLKTKIIPPAHRPGYINRTRLFERLNSCLHTRLVMISAPPGYGKTTLAASWLRFIGAPFTWLTLDADDNDPARLLTYIQEALKVVQVEAGFKMDDLPEKNIQIPVEPYLIEILNRTSEANQDFWLVLDDFHTLLPGPALNAIVFLLEHQSYRFHLLITTRTDPLLPLANMRAHGDVFELHVQELGFSWAECDQFLRQTMGLDLDDEAVTALEKLTEGWVAGLQLAALTLRGSNPEEASRFIVELTGGHHLIDEFLIQEVLLRQTGQVQEFLLTTSILDRLNASLCDMVTGLTGSQALLHKMEDDNLFITPLDETRRWYRYHPLFQTMLHQRLEMLRPEEDKVYHQRASNWYAHEAYAQGGNLALLSVAIHHSLAGKDFNKAGILIEDAAEAVMMGGELVTLQDWMEHLPDEVIRSRPRLCIINTWMLLSSSNFERTAFWLEQAENWLDNLPEKLSSGFSPGITRQWMLGNILAARSLLVLYQGDMNRSGDLAEQALGYLNDHDTFIYHLAAWVKGVSQLGVDDYSAASRDFFASILTSRRSGNILVVLLSLYTLGMMLILRGKLFQAEKIFQEGLLLGEPEIRPVGAYALRPGTLSKSLMHQGLGEIHRERGSLLSAKDLLKEAINLAEAWGNAEVLADQYVSMARISYSLGDGDQASYWFEKAQIFVREQRVAIYTRMIVEAYQARLWIAQDRLTAAIFWAESISEAEVSSGYGQNFAYPKLVQKNTIIRLYLAQGKWEEASELAKKNIQQARDGGWRGLEIESLALLALALDAMGNGFQAEETLTCSLKLGATEGYRCLFVDEGEPMKRLLQRLLKPGKCSPELQGFVQEIIPTFIQDARVKTVLSRINPGTDGQLSSREAEILDMITAGYSNSEIAEHLVISLSTVKTHVNHIFRKLGVSTRAQAVSRGLKMKSI